MGTAGDGPRRSTLETAMHAGFLLLLAAGASRLLIRHPLDAKTVASLSLAAGTAVLYVAGVLVWNRMNRGGRLAWFGAVIACWLILSFLAPSSVVAVVPLLFLSLKLLSPRATIAIAALLTVAAIVALFGLNDVIDPSLILAPVAIAGMTVATVLALRRSSILEERARLAREIHDTLAQGLSGIALQLQTADRLWDTHPDRARMAVHRAEALAVDNLEEARAFVRGLRPPVLNGGGLVAALRAEAVKLPGVDVRVHVEGELDDLSPESEAVLLRVAQGALANVREHSGARTAVVTVSRIGDDVNLDVRDDGTGFDPDAPVSYPGRGYGLSAMRERAAALDGYLAVESAPGEGTAVSVSVPVTGKAQP